MALAECDLQDLTVASGRVEQRSTTGIGGDLSKVLPCLPNS